LGYRVHSLRLPVKIQKVDEADSTRGLSLSVPLKRCMDSAALDSEDQEKISPEGLRFPALVTLVLPIMGEGARGFSDVVLAGTGHSQNNALSGPGLPAEDEALPQIRVKCDE